jgi:hypothetical protein
MSNMDRTCHAGAFRADPIGMHGHQFLSGRGVLRLTAANLPWPGLSLPDLGNNLGDCAFRLLPQTSLLGWWATLRNLPKPWEPIPFSRRPILGYGRRTIRVLGGVAWTKWLTTLTGESPTSSA